MFPKSSPYWWKEAVPPREWNDSAPESPWWATRRPQDPPAPWWKPNLTPELFLPGIPATAEGSRAGESALPFWALLGFTFILLMAPQSFVPALAPFRIALCATAVATAAHLWDRLSRGRPVSVCTREITLAACLAGWAVVNVPFSLWPGGSVTLLLGKYSKTLIVFWLLCNIMTSPRRFRRLALALSLMSAPLGATGIHNFLSGSFLVSGSRLERIAGYQAALTANPNDLALMLNLLLPLSVALFLIYRRPVVRLLLLAIIGLSVTAVVLTFSRGGFVTLTVTSLLYLWKFRGRRERTWVVAGLVLALLSVPFLPSGYMTRLSTILNKNADPTGSAQNRWSDMVSAAEYLIGHPIIGAGAGDGILALNKQRKEKDDGQMWEHVHDAYLQYGLDLGFPGLILFLLLLTACIRSAALVRRRSAAVPALRDLFYLSEGIQISLCAFAVSAVFHPVAYEFYFYYMAGLAVAIKGVYESETGAGAEDRTSSDLQLAGLEV